jgi:hypothetical protein
MKSTQVPAGRLLSAVKKPPNLFPLGILGSFVLDSVKRLVLIEKVMDVLTIL